MENRDYSYESEKIYEIKYKTSTEISIESTATKSYINNISNFGYLVNENAEKAFKLGSTILSRNNVVENIGTAAIGFVAGENLVQGTQIAGQVIGHASTLALAAYVGYKLYENLQNDITKVTFYNMLEWGRVHIGLQVPKKPVPQFRLISSNFEPAKPINKEYHSIVVTSGSLYLEKYYNSITLFILGNFIYNIDIILDKFLDDNKAQNLTNAWYEDEYAKSKLQSRRKYLCAENPYINSCIKTATRYGMFPNDHEYGYISSKQVDIINNYIQGATDQFQPCIKKSMVVFMFKTLQFACDILKAGEYKFSDYYKTELIKYVQSKDLEFQFINPEYKQERNIYYTKTKAENIYITENCIVETTGTFLNSSTIVRHK